MARCCLAIERQTICLSVPFSSDAGAKAYEETRAGCGYQPGMTGATYRVTLFMGALGAFM